MNILLLEDDVILSEIIVEHLQDKGFSVKSCYDGMSAYDLIEKNSYDIMILDVNVPHLNGFELLKLIKEQNIKTPSIFITSLNSSQDVKHGFDIGADDYLKKPFDLVELEVRIEHLIRVYNLQTDEIGIDDDLRLNTTNQTLTNKNKTITLAKKEFEILRYLLQNKNKTISKDELISNIWIVDTIPTDATIRTYIKNLRNMLPKEYIVSKKGVGYRFVI
jgi:DNA-binding response OmpR family regulator